MEYFDIVDKKGLPTGKIVARDIAHEQGIRHRTSHVWILRKKDNKIQILLQKRSDNKDSYPGCYDISSAGHIPAGSDFIPSAIRELKEELDINAKKSEFIYCGQRNFKFEQEFYHKIFRDNQVSNIYCMWLDKEESDFRLQEEEVSEVRWLELSDCIRKVEQNLIPHCIFMEELQMVQRAVLGQ